MTSNKREELIAQIDKLIHEYEALRGRAQYDDISDLKDESNSIVVRLARSA